MKSIQPVEEHTHYKYDCPECGWSHWISTVQLTYPGFFIVCDCGTAFTAGNSTSKSAKTRQPSSNNLKEIYDILCSQGFHKAAVKTAYDKTTITGDIDKDIMEIIRNYEPPS